MKAFIVSAAASSAGKTTATLGIMEALRRRGLSVQPFKAGPDYIDPGHHAALLNRPSYNLDTWMMGAEGVRRTFRRKVKGSDVAVVEGVMGLFDGRDGRSEEGSTAHLAKVLNVPVLLVVNAEKTARSAAAVVKGFKEFDSGVKVRWVLFNRVGSPRHFEMLKDSVSAIKGVKVLGHIPRDKTLTMPERHLGLITSRDFGRGEWRRFIKRAGDIAEEFMDLDTLLGKGLRRGRDERPLPDKKVKPTRRPRIAVALDGAFCFYYEENFDILREFGAELVFFSPLKDKRLPRPVDGIYIGGGYPELYARTLEKNLSMREEIKRSSLAGVPVYAECGGLMYLGNGIKDASGKGHSMAGVFPWTTRMSPERKALGYREVKALKGCPFIKEGAILRGHEYRYSALVKNPPGVDKVFEARRPGSGESAREGFVYRNTLASYVHLHFASNPDFARGFVERCSSRGTF